MSILLSIVLLLGKQGAEGGYFEAKRESYCMSFVFCYFLFSAGCNVTFMPLPFTALILSIRFHSRSSSSSFMDPIQSGLTANAFYYEKYAKI